jgi:hypothetical protein
MELHFRRAPLILIGIVFLAFGVFCGFLVFIYVAANHGLVPSDFTRRVFVRKVGGCGLGLLVGGVSVALGLQPFRFHIGAQGLTLRLPLAGINGLVPWAAIDAIVIEQRRSSRKQAPRLLVVPAEGVDLGVPAPHRSPVDKRACLELLTFNDVKESPEQVGQALAQYGGSRFADARPRSGQDGGSGFTLALRGYDTARVDELVRRGQAALHSASATERLTVRGEIDSVSLPIATRGYDRTQVDAFLTALSTELASPRT